MRVLTPPCRGMPFVWSRFPLGRTGRPRFKGPDEPPRLVYGLDVCDRPVATPPPFLEAEKVELCVWGRRSLAVLSNVLASLTFSANSFPNKYTPGTLVSTTSFSDLLNMGKIKVRLV